MINIISRAYVSKNISGPKKVVDNLIKGLDLIGYPYVVNGSLDSCTRLWIHDDEDALMALKNAKNDVKTIAGPNIFILPRNIPANIDLSGNIVYIQPSPWVVDFWKYLGFDACPLDSWPTGIDTDRFKPASNQPNKKLVLIYFKQRYPEELRVIENILKTKGISYKIIYYGNYDQKEYIDMLSDTRYMIWLGRQESQGIALEEALSCNIPMIVWDVSNIGHVRAPQKEMDVFNEMELSYRKTTSAQYFDNRCGQKIFTEKELSSAIDGMESGWQGYESRAYILENLSLEKQAKDFISIYEKYFGLTFAEGVKEGLLNNNRWKNSRFTFKLLVALKDLLKILKRQCV